MENGSSPPFSSLLERSHIAIGVIDCIWGDSDLLPTSNIIISVILVIIACGMERE